jgi:hypothetical protein
MPHESILCWLLSDLSLWSTLFNNILDSKIIEVFLAVQQNICDYTNLVANNLNFYGSLEFSCHRAEFMSRLVWLQKSEGLMVRSFQFRRYSYFRRYIKPN